MKLHAQRTLKITLILSFLGWTSLFAIMLSIEYPAQDRRLEQMLHLKMEMLYQRTQAIRSWIGAHGGVYAATDDKVKPNELLRNHPERDIITPSGRCLTLLNSPSFLRQISEDFEAKSGTRIRFVSDRPINPDDLVDAWEKSGLEELRKGKDKVSSLVVDNDNIRYRMLTPMVMSKKCISCHEGIPWKVGDIAGGISINLDAAGEYQQNQAIKHTIILNHSLLWLVGVIGLLFAGNIWKRLLVSLERSAMLDPLTGIYNRREMLHRLEASLSYCARHQHQLRVIMFDIDHFKRINDNYNHQMGDAVLKTVALAMQKELRSSDVLARYGGEEFLVICPQTDEEAAVRIAERIRTRIASLSMTTKSGNIKLTISAGVAGYPDYQTVNKLIDAADSAMYKAKNEGRNRVACM